MHLWDLSPNLPEHQMLTSHGRLLQVLFLLSQTSWLPARPDLVSLTLASFCQCYKKFYQDFCLQHKKEGAHCRLPATPPPSPKSLSVCTFSPITCTNSIRKHLSTPSLFTFKGLNSLFTGLSTSRGPHREESPVQFCAAGSLVFTGLFLLLSCNIHDNRVGLFLGALWGSIGGATLSQERPLFMWI